MLFPVSFFTAYQVNLGRDSLLFTGEESVYLTWTRDAVFPFQDPDTYTVDVCLYTLTGHLTWIQSVCLASNILNSGSARVIIPHMERSKTDPRFSAIAIQLGLNISQVELQSFQDLTTSAGLWTVVAYTTDAPPTREECSIWAGETDARMAEQEKIKSESPPCPCTLQQARAPNSGFTEQTREIPNLKYFNPGATTCFYQSVLTHFL